jgi:acyl transferase domain-containing protein/acyl carrier protein
MTGAEIAIIGMSGRFPDAANIREFWGNLINGKESIKFLSEEEIAQLQDPAFTGNPNYVGTKGGHLDNLDWFDAAFFNYTPKEAEIMDPQFRLFHECVWNALEDAGYAKENYPGLVGLYAGASGNFQWQKKLKDSKKYANRKGLTSIQFVERDFLPTLVSYNLNLKGPSYNVQTACSTSLVAVHLACQAILNGECDMALAGGVSISYGLDKGYLYQEGSIFSPDGHCRAFDAKSKGCIHGSGAGVVVLKLLEDAIAHNDHIYAVIKGSAINNDGKRKVGFTAPSILGQADVIKSAHQVAEVDPANVSYIEAHGTGTEIGDPIEMEALKMVFANSGLQHCGIGSVKTNIGHLDAAAGVTGLIKTALALKHRTIPPSLHFTTPNPKIDFKNSSFYVVDRVKEWKSDELRLAGVSSFGIGGTNAHVVLEEARQTEPTASERSMHLLNFSARTKNSLDKWTNSFAEFLENENGHSIADIAYTLQNGRKTFDTRAFIACSTIGEAIEKLKLGDVFFNEGDASAKPIVFMFPGQGSQYVNMGLDLFRTEPLFTEELKACLEIYTSVTGQDLQALLYPANGEDTSNAITQTSITQPLLFIFEYAMARFLMKLGIQPQLMIGHSIGEYVAACIAGVINLKDAIKLVVKRGQLIQQLPRGSMLSVLVNEKDIQPYLNENISLAVVNSSSACVVSGPADAIEALQQQLKSNNISCTLLKTSHAFHSFMMEPALEQFKKSFEGIQLNAPSIPFISNVTGDFISNEDAVSPGYWAKQLRSTVKFAAGLERLMQQDEAVLVEVGPGNSLSNFVIKHAARKDTHKLVSTVRNARVAGKDDQHFYEAIGKLWLSGAAIDFSLLYANETRKKVSLPGYCYDRIKLDTPEETVRVKEETAPEAKRPLTEWFYSPVWEQSPPAVSTVTTEFFSKGQWLVFANEQGLSAALTRYLPVDNLKIIQAGQPLSEEDCTGLIKSLQLDDNAPLNIIHAWSLNENHSELSIERCEQQLNNNFYTLLNFIRALGFRKETTHLTVLTNNTYAITGGDLRYPENTAHAALVKILPLEYKNLTCQLIDLSTEHLTGGNELETVQQIFSIISKNNPEKITALRGQCQWTPAVKQVNPERYTSNNNLLSGGKVYVVLGLGGMGVYMAKYIADTFDSTVIIIHRSPFPPANEWQSIMENGNGQVAAKVRILHEASTHAKGQIYLMQGDIADLQSMSTIVHKIEDTHGRISGIIHAAGVIDKGGVVHRRSNKSIADSIESKLKGAIIIDTLFRNKPLDFFMLFSSLGNEFYEEKYGELGYNVANEFLDAYVQAASGIKRKICINWCDWQEVGMAMKAIDALFNADGSRQKEIEQFNATAILPKEGVEAFAKVCNSSLARVLLYPFDLHARLRQRDKTLLNYSAYLEKKFTLLADATADNNFVPQVKFNSLDENVINIWKEYLGHKEISVHDNIFELGASSLDVVTVRNIFKSSLGIDVPVTALFEYPTIHAFLKFIKGGEAEDNSAEASERIDKGRNKLGKLKKLSTKG